MKLVLAHDYLIQMGGAERVVAAMHRRFPAAPIYTSAISRGSLWHDFDNAEIHTSILQHAPWIEDHVHFKKYFPLFALAFQSFGKVDADCAWISASTFAKFLQFTPTTRTVCYIHSPTRFLWQTDEYLPHEVSSSAVGKLVRATLPTLRKLDRQAAMRMDVLVANSRNVQERIRQFYGLESLVIYPPVNTVRFTPTGTHDGTYLIVSRLLGYKKIDLAVRAFTKSGRKLVIIGEGPDREGLERQAGNSVTFLGWVSEEETRRHFEQCRALVVSGHEDFAIAPVEAMAAGKPVIALREGGVMETVVDGETGVFFDEDTEESLLEAVGRFEHMTWDADHIRRRADEFSEERFLDQTEALLRATAAGLVPRDMVLPCTIEFSMSSPEEAVGNELQGADRRDLSERGLRRRAVFGELLKDDQDAWLKSEEAREFFLRTLNGWKDASGETTPHSPEEPDDDRHEKVYQELLQYLVAAGVPSEEADEKLRETLNCW